MTIRIDTFRNRLAGTRGLLALTEQHLDDLYVLAYDRHRAGQAQRVAGGERDYALDTHGDPKARELWQRTALKVLDAAEDLTVVLHEVTSYFNPGRISTRRDTTADAPISELIEAMAARQRRRDRGEYQPATLIDQPTPTEPASIAGELELLRSAARKIAPQIEDRGRLTPAEHDALRRAIDPTFTRSKRKKSKAS